MKPYFYLTAIIFFLALVLSLTPGGRLNRDTPAPYITVEALAPQQTEFTEAEYRARVRGQIERDGVVAICYQHLRTLALDAKSYTVDHARQNLLYVEECAQAEASRNDGTLQAGP